MRKPHPILGIIAGAAVAWVWVASSLPAQTRSRRAPASAADLRQAMLVAEDSRSEDAAVLAPLFQGLRSGDPELQRIAVRGIGRLEQWSLSAQILPFLSAASPALRAEAANALGQAAQGLRARGGAHGSDLEVSLGESSLTERLRGEVDSAVRGVLFETLGRLPYVTDDQFSRVCGVLQMGITDSGAPSDATLGALAGLETLIRSAKAAAKTVVIEPAAATQLRHVVSGRPGRSGALQFPARARRLALTILNAVGASEPSILADAMADPDDQVRRLAVAGSGSKSEAAQIVETGSHDRSPMVRLEALGAAGSFPNANSVRAIFIALHDPAPPVALLAIDLLGNMASQPERGDGVGTPGVIPERREGDPANRDGARASGVLQERAIEQLVRLAETLSTTRAEDAPGWHRPAHALVALAKLSRERAIALLPRFAVHPQWQVRMYAARAATILAASARLDLMAHDENANVREAAISGLARTKRHDADAVYAQALGSRDYQLVRTAAAALEGSPNAQDAVPALLGALARITAEKRDTSRDVRAAILERLRDLGSPPNAAALRPYLNDFDSRIAALAAEIMAGWDAPSPAAAQRMVPRPAADLGHLESAPRARVLMRSGGSFDLELFPDEAPITVSRFVRLARSGYYNGLTFHRVVPNFAIQGGSPGANEYMGDGPFLRDELGLRPHLRGALGISTRGRDTGDAQIFIDLIDNPRLDHQYTVFAEVTQGMDVVDAVLEGDVIERIDIFSR